MYVGTVEIDSRVIVMFIALSSPFSSQRKICSFPQCTYGAVVCSLNIRNFKIQRRDHNENERKKKENCRLHEQNNNFARASHTVQLFAVFAKWVGTIAVKTERTQIHFLNNVLVAVASLDLQVKPVPVVF